MTGVCVGGGGGGLSYYTSTTRVSECYVSLKRLKLHVCHFVCQLQLLAHIVLLCQCCLQQFCLSTVLSNERTGTSLDGIHLMG